MLTVIIPTLDSERPLVRTLAPLVAGATAGLISEVVVADGGSADDTAAVADIAGCRYLQVEGSRGRRLKTAAGTARAPWLMFLCPGVVLDTPWVGAVRAFVGRPAAENAAASFGRGGRNEAGLAGALTALGAALRSRPHPRQGLLISSVFYAALGGHADQDADPEGDLLRRIGRRRLAALAARAFE